MILDPNALHFCARVGLQLKEDRCSQHTARTEMDTVACRFPCLVVQYLRIAGYFK